MYKDPTFRQDWFRTARGGNPVVCPAFPGALLKAQMEVWRVEDGYVNMQIHGGIKTSAS